MNFNKTEDVVRHVLKNKPETRKNDFLLVKETYDYYGNTELSFSDFCKKAVDNCIPSFETVTRLRRKIQSENPEIYGDSETIIKRQENEERVLESLGYR